MNKVTRFLDETARLLPVSFIACVFAILALSIAGFFKYSTVKEVIMVFNITVVLMSFVLKPLLGVFETEQ